MIVLLNLSSLVLGLFAWIIPIANLVQYGKHNYMTWVTRTILSMSACAISLCLQIFSINHRVRVADWSALMDTMSAVVFISAVLLIVTIVLNTITLIKYRGRITN